MSKGLPFVSCEYFAFSAWEPQEPPEGLSALSTSLHCEASPEGQPGEEFPDVGDAILSGYKERLLLASCRFEGSSGAS